jgi:co-chaperonin GroES (HSP10)
MQAINFYLIVEKIKLGPSIVGGLELTESQNKDIRYLKGKVVSVGSQVIGVCVDDTVWYDKHAGNNIEINNKIYKVIKNTDVVIVE